MRAATAIVVMLLCTTAFAQEHKVGVLSYSLPVYPPIARQAHVTGDVLVSFEVDCTGNTIVKSVSGHPMLKAQFKDLLPKWRLVCTSCRFGEKTEQRVTFRFELSEIDSNSARYLLSFPGLVKILRDPPVPLDSSIHDPLPQVN